MLTGLIPDRNQMTLQSRALIAETVASASSLFLQNSDFTSIRLNLEFIVNRHPDVLAASVIRESDGSEVIIGEVPASGDAANDARISVPVLTDEGVAWGQVMLDYKPVGGTLWYEKLQRSRIFLFVFLLLSAFLLFYIYLGKMLKQLNPSTAVPARVRSALDTIAESLVVVNRKTEIVLANSAFSKLTGEAPEKLLGVKVASLAWSQSNSEPQDSSAAGELPWIAALKTNQASRNDMLWFEDKEGKKHTFIVNCSPVAGPSGKAGGVLISLDDVTVLEEKEQELLRSKEQAEAASHAKSDFLSNMSHEIRTPMTAILGFTEVLKRGYGRDEDSAQKYLNTISSSGKHLLGLINDILDLSKVESGALEVERIECPVNIVIQDIVQVLDVKAKEKGIYLRVEYPEKLPEYILSDPARLRQIITNLVGNAIKFTEVGGVTISCRLVQAKNNSQLELDVTDTGIGMTPAQADSIFEAFVQADSTITRRFGGTGLGLSISRDLAQALGGDIRVKSQVGSGSTFTVVVDSGDLSQVPMLTAAELLAVSQNTQNQVEKTYYFENTRVLVVDDAQENRDLLGLVLTELNIQFVEANNGQQALDRISDGSFDMVLMDVQMPVLDGFQAAAGMRARGYESPVIALTANAMKGFEKEIEASSYSHYMTKPIDLDKLIQLIASLVPGKVTEKSDMEISRENSSSPESAISDADSAASKIYSELAAKKPEFMSISNAFLERLDGRLAELDSAVGDQQFEQIAEWAHWLKGSGGSVGFAVFSDPAKELEIVAKKHDLEAVIRHTEAIKKLAARCEPGSAQDKNKASVTYLSEKTNSASGAEARADTQIYSELIGTNPEFKDIVSRFVPKLKDRVSAMKDILAAGDYSQLAADAHWLKGSGGSVGFRVFTNPAAELEQAAIRGSASDCQKYLTEILEMSSRLSSLAAQQDSDFTDIANGEPISVSKINHSS